MLARKPLGVRESAPPFGGRTNPLGDRSGLRAGARALQMVDHGERFGRRDGHDLVTAVSAAGLTRHRARRQLRQEVLGEREAAASVPCASSTASATVGRSASVPSAVLAVASTS